jgi:phage/plasmid-associated DNA primase
MSCRGALLVTMTEPGPKEQLVVEVVKRLTGGDSVTGRSLWGNTETFPWTAAMLSAGNRVLASGLEFSEAIVLRIKVLEFIYTFKRGASKEAGTREKEINYALFGKLKKDPVYGAQLIGMALDNLKRLKDEHAKLNEEDRDGTPLVAIPESVKNAIQEYQRSNNPMEEFFTANVVKRNNGCILQNTMMTRFKWWINEEYTGDTRFRNIDVEHVKTGLLKHGMHHTKTNGGRWGFHHFALKNLVDVPLSKDDDVPGNDDVPMTNEPDIRGKGPVITKRRRESTVEPTGSESD